MTGKVFASMKVMGGMLLVLSLVLAILLSFSYLACLDFIWRSGTRFGGIFIIQGDVCLFTLEDVNRNDAFGYHIGTSPSHPVSDFCTFRPRAIPCGSGTWKHQVYGPGMLLPALVLVNLPLIISQLNRRRIEHRNRWRLVKFHIAGICPGCGAALREGLGHCVKCGKALSARPVMQTVYARPWRLDDSRGLR